MISERSARSGSPSPGRAVGQALVALVLIACWIAVGTAHASSHVLAKRGGTLRVNVSNGDFDFTDPGLAYTTLSWAMLYTTQVLLVNYPEKNGAAGGVLYPEAATSFPIVSQDGRTYTFHIRPGLRFSDGTPVTAGSYRRAWERILSPKMGSPRGVNDSLQTMVVGAQAFFDGKSPTISGITAKGLTLTFRLTRPSPTFTSILAMQWFGAVKPDMPYTSTGLDVYPSAGPYYIQSRDRGRSLVEARNPYYKGSRPANPDRIVWTVNTDTDTSYLQVDAGQADVDALGPPPTDFGALAAKYGVNKRRFFVGPTSCVNWWALNTSRPPFSKLAYRQAVNWAIDRPSLVRQLGKYGGRRTDQILVPGMPGYRPYNQYAYQGARPDIARKVAGGTIPGTVVVIHGAGPQALYQAEIVEYDLGRIGAKTRDVTYQDDYIPALTTRGVDMDMALTGWCADYFDPFDYINVNFDGRSITDHNNLDTSYLNSPTLNRQMDHAALLFGKARATAYAALDREIMSRYAPVVPFAILNGVFFVSSRVSNFVYQPYFGEPAFNALSIG